MPDQPISGPSNQPISGPSNQPIGGPSGKPLKSPERHAEDQAELKQVYTIIDPWMEVSQDNEPFILTVKSGRKYQLQIPLGAAVEIEQKGFDIKAGEL